MHEQTTARKLQDVLGHAPINDRNKLDKQQRYYANLKKKGVAVKEKYKLQPMGSLKKTHSTY